MKRDNEPLNKEERLVVFRALINAHLRYRAIPLRTVCRDLGIALRKQYRDEISGLFNGYFIEIPGKSPPAVKEHTFWHEVGHAVLGQLEIFPRYVGYYAYQYSFSARHWSEERSVEAFATAMTLYRFGIDPHLEIHGERFIFADEVSDWYLQMMRFESKRILDVCREAAQEGKNSANLPALKVLGALLEKLGSATDGLQRDLPMSYPDTHRELGDMRFHYVNWQDDLRRNDVHASKDSWRLLSLREWRLTALAKAVIYARTHEQLALFEEKTQADRCKLEKRRKWLEKTIHAYVQRAS